MNEDKYNNILYIILSVIVLTIGLQVYWNYKNYLQNKQNFINQVQVSFDNALDTYYADLAESNAMTFIDVDTDTDIHIGHQIPFSFHYGKDTGKLSL